MGPQREPFKACGDSQEASGGSGGPPHPPLPPHSPTSRSTGRETTAGQGEMAGAMPGPKGGGGWVRTPVSEEGGCWVPGLLGLRPEGTWGLGEKDKNEDPGSWVLVGEEGAGV